MNETFSRQRERFLAVERKFMFMLEGPDDDMPCAKAFQRIALFARNRRLRQLSAKPSTEKKAHNSLRESGKVFQHIRSKNQFVVVTSLFVFS